MIDLDSEESNIEAYLLQKNFNQISKEKNRIIIKQKIQKKIINIKL